MATGSSRKKNASPRRKEASRPKQAESSAVEKNARIFKMAFASVYPLYVQKAERKRRAKEEVDEIITWLTGYTQPQLQRAVDTKIDFETFFSRAPQLNPNMERITGVVCGVRVEDVSVPLMRKIRCLDKLIDELARGRALDKILRNPSPQGSTAAVTEQFLQACPPTLLDDVKALDGIISKNAPTLAPVIQGSMLAYGPFQYRYESGREGRSARISMACRKNGIALYFNCVDNQGYLAEQFAARFLKAKVGKSCVAFRRLADLDEKALVELIQLASRTKGAGEMG
jgi:hypothetical protein